jgi:hypothetical protein
MGELLRKFTYQRNAFRSNAGKSAEAAFEAVARASAQQLQVAEDGSVKDEAFNDGKAFLGTVSRNKDGRPSVTEVGRVFEQMYLKNPIDAWQWLVTRAMWRNSMPNGTQSAANSHVRKHGFHFNFFDLMLRTMWHLGAHPAPENILFFDELAAILDDDKAWMSTPESLYQSILVARDGDVTLAGHRSWLGDLEEKYKISRDNMSTVFNKAFKQCGLFDIVEYDSKTIGVRIGTEAASQPILARRLRFVLDNPSFWNDDR